MKARDESRPLKLLRRRTLTLGAAAAVVLLAGCTMNGHDSVTVGAIPDDYRTSHPIVIAEKEQVIDLPVGASERGMTRTQRVALGGFLSDYDRSASPVLSILVPTGSYNEVAASAAGSDFAHYARKYGVPSDRIVVASYQAESVEASAPVRVMYTAMKAQTNKCGRWTANIGDTDENKHYTDYGCSSQNNLAAQIANPADLLGPRKMSEIDAEKRSGVIDQYRLPSDTTNSEVEY